MRVNESDPADPYRLYIADDEGRLITRAAPSDVLTLHDDELRVDTRMEVTEGALAFSKDVTLDADSPSASGQFTAQGRNYLITLARLPRTQDWRVVVVGPEDYYLAGPLRARRWMAGVALVMLVLLVTGATITSRALRRALARIAVQSERMRQFQFDAVRDAEAHSAFADIDRVLGGLEQAKTAMRALGKYAPVDLVRELYDQNREPTLGGELRALSIMFTDIKDFTTVSEQLPPAELAPTSWARIWKP